MNFDRIKKAIGQRVQLRPPALVLDEHGQGMGDYDHVWTIDAVSDDDVKITNTTTGHFTHLGKDHVHHFTSNPDETRRVGIPHGFFVLTVQLAIKGNEVTVTPSARPGEPVEVAKRDVKELLVDFRYPQDSGLQSRQEALGYQVAWANESRIARLVHLEGYEVVVERAPNGGLVSFRLKDRPEDKIFVKRPKVAT